MLKQARQHNPWIILIDDTGVGTGLSADLRTEGLDAIDISATQSKETRAHIQTPKFASGRVLFPKSAPWLADLEAALRTFQARRHDDQVDPIVQALALIKSNSVA